MTSLRVRLLALITGIAVLVTALSVTLVSRAADQALRAQNQADLADNAAIYQALADWGTRHHDWRTADTLVGRLSKQYDARIALTDLRGGLLVDSDDLTGHSRRELPESPTARVDPWLPTVSTLVTGDAHDRALGKHEAATEYSVPALNLSQLKQCMRHKGFEAITRQGAIMPRRESNAAWTAVAECYDEVGAANSAPVALLYLGSGTSLAGPFDSSALPRTLSIAAAILALAALVGWWLGRRLTRPLAELAETATLLKDGDLDVRVDAHGADEVGRVGLALNSLADSLQRNERLRRQLVSDVAHELGNPVVVIGGTLEAIQDGIYPPSTEVLDSLGEEVEHLRTLVGDLADLARADTDGLGLHRQPMEFAALGGLCESVVEAARPVAHRHGIELTCLVGGAGEAVVSGDPARLRQVLHNLVSNALRHTARGGSVRVILSAGDSGADPVRIRVCDTGSGIAAEDLPYIFERFWRADAARGTATGGTGLGLAIARELVAAHGGSIKVTSTLGEGTEFDVHLPSLPDAGQAAASRSTASLTRSSVAVNATRT